jgi:ribose transport system substrate-binding protein
MKRMTQQGRSLTLAAFLVVALAVFLTACGGGGDSSNSSTETTEAAGAGNEAGETGGGTKDTATTLSAEGDKFVYIGGEVGDPNYKAVGCGAKEKAEELGADFEQQDAKSFAPSDQIPVLNAAAAQNPSGLMISPTDPKALYAPLKAIDGRLPVETVVNTLENTDSINGQVLVDNRGGGEEAAVYLAELADGKEVEVGAFSFQRGGSKAADDELEGFEAKLKDYPNITYIGAQFQGPDSQITDAAAKMNAILASHPKLFGMFATYGFAAEGILASRLQRGSDFDLVAAYAATTPQLVKALKEGALAAIVDYPFREAGAAAIEQLAANLDGQTVKPSVEFKSITYTKQSFGNPEEAENLGPAEC